MKREKAILSVLGRDTLPTTFVHIGHTVSFYLLSRLWLYVALRSRIEFLSQSIFVADHAWMSTSLTAKLDPARFSEMSPFMAAIVGYILGESFTTPAIAEIKVSEIENVVYVRPEGSVGFDGLQSLEDLRNNWNQLMDAAGLTADERTEAVRKFHDRISAIPGTEH